MLNSPQERLRQRIKQSLQISWISAFLLSTATWNNLPAQAVDASQILGGNLTWECDLSATVESTIRSSQNKNPHGLSCRSTQSAADPAAVNGLVQQGIQLLQQAQMISAADPAAMEQLIQRGLQLLQTAHPSTTSDPAVQQLIQQGLQLLQPKQPAPVQQSSLAAPK
jgi:hypothetical protein